MGDEADDHLPKYIKFEPERYDLLLKEKVERARAAFGWCFEGGVVRESELDIFRSAPSHYRQRCKLGVANADDPNDVDPTEGEDGAPPADDGAAADGSTTAGPAPMHWFMYDAPTPGQPALEALVSMTTFPLASRAINAAMPLLLAELDALPPRAPLRRRLRVVSADAAREIGSAWCLHCGACGTHRRRWPSFGAYALAVH